MNTYKFTGIAIIEADNEEEAKEKFADNSYNFAGSAIIEEEKGGNDENI